jgi:hypothetical protein
MILPVSFEDTAVSVGVDPVTTAFAELPLACKFKLNMDGTIVSVSRAIDEEPCSMRQAFAPLI